MYTKHFLRQFIRLIGMALLGLAVLVFINHYQKSQVRLDPDLIQPSVNTPQNFDTEDSQ